jgi:AraC-like DNA-binding protein
MVQTVVMTALVFIGHNRQMFARSVQAEQLDALVAAVERHAEHPGGASRIPGQHLARVDRSAGEVELHYSPMVCFVVQGAKHALCGRRTLTVSRGHLFLGLVEAPVTASFETPYRSITLELDEDRLVGLLMELDDTARSDQEHDDAFVTTPLDSALADAVLRWVTLLDEPQHATVLARRIEDEIIYRLLVGPAGAILRAGLKPNGRTSRVRAAATHLATHLREPFSLAGTAEVAHISPATLLRHFREVTGTTPLQFHKQMRLQRARQLITVGDHTAASAAAAVGYLSASQFSRDYRRRYGAPPRQHAAATVATTRPEALTGSLGVAPREPRTAAPGAVHLARAGSNRAGAPAR